MRRTHLNIILGAVISLILIAPSCKKPRTVQTAFYYWKTVYGYNQVEQEYFQALQAKKMYLRIMDVDASENGIVPISPVSFKATIADSIELVPVVFVVNDVLKVQTPAQLADLAAKIVRYVTGKLPQSGRRTFSELQIDCDWTASTRSNYFCLLKCISTDKVMKNKKLSATLRLHQLKNRQSSGIPPVNRVMLMCYNMGNLRKYGIQNSILEESELEKYIGNNLATYPMPVDIGLPLFRWAVVFRQRQYLGIAKRINQALLSDKTLFFKKAPDLYQLDRDLPVLGLKHGDEVRWETIEPEQLQHAANYLQKYTSSDTLNIIYFHLDEQTLKYYRYETLEKTAALFR